jgi:hypothetical protein
MRVTERESSKSDLKSLGTEIRSNRAQNKALAQEYAAHGRAPG